MKNIIKIKYNINLERDMLKLKLEQKEIVQYNSWKAIPENTSSREAMEKVVAKLKLDDSTWLEEESNLLVLKNRATLVNNLYEVLVGYIGKDYDIQSIDNIAEAWIEEFELGVWLWMKH